MAEEKPFHFGGADDLQDGPMFQEDLSIRRLERLSRRVTVLIVVLTCLFGFVLYFGYRDLTGRLNRSQTDGVQEVQKLSEDILTKFNEISAKLVEYETQLAGVENSIKETGETVDRTSAAYQTADAALTSSVKDNSESIEKLTGAIDALKAEKLNKTDFSEFEATLKDALLPLNSGLETIGDLKQEIEALAPLREQIDSLSAIHREMEDLSIRLTSLENSLAKDLNAFATYVEKTNQDLDQIQSSMSAMSKDMVGQEKLNYELQKITRSNRLTVLKEITKVQQDLNAIRDRVDRLERSPSRSSIIRPPSGSQGPASASQSGKVSEQEIAD